MKSNSIKSYGALAVAGFCLFFGLAANAAKPTKIDVCHVPADTPDNTQIIQLSNNKGTALVEHMLHGDWEVSTEPNCDTVADNDCDGEPDDTADGDAFCDDGDDGTTDSCNTDIGECVNEPIVVECPCIEFWEGDNPTNFAFPTDYTQPFRRDPSIGNCQTFPIYFDNATSSHFLGASLLTSGFGQCSIDGPDGQIKNKPATLDLAVIQACIRYIETIVPVTNGCLTE